MRMLNGFEMEQVSGGAHGHWKSVGVGREWGKFVDWVNGMTNTVNSDIRDLVTLGQPGSNPACNALGNTLGPLGHIAGAANGGQELDNIGKLCNGSVNSVQHSLGEQPASGTSAR